MAGIEITGLDEVLTDFAETGGRMSDLRPALVEVASNLRNAIGREQFATRGSARGQSWGASLVRTGGLRRSFESRTSRFHVERIEKDGMEWGSSHPLARLHQRSRGLMRVSKKTGKASGVLRQRLILTFRNDLDERVLVLEPIERHIALG